MTKKSIWICVHTHLRTASVSDAPSAFALLCNRSCTAFSLVIAMISFKKLKVPFKPLSLKPHFKSLKKKKSVIDRLNTLVFSMLSS